MVFRPKIDAKLCFVLMPFGQPFDGYYNHIIKPVVEKAGVSPLRADEIYNINPIIQDIWGAIWRARVVIADVTDRNPNVNYELGLCHALGVPTILITKRIEDVPFDYRHRRCITYKTDEAGWEQRLGSALEKTVAAVLAETEFDTELAWPYDTRALMEMGKGPTLISVENPREIVIRGSEHLESLISKAFGPSGVNISISTSSHDFVPRKRGLDIATGIRSANALEENGIEQMRQVARFVQNACGDCTKTAILISHAMLLRGHAAVSQGHDVRGLIRGMEAAVRTAVSSLAAQSKPTGAEELFGVALTASGDRRIASLIVRAMNEAGKDGVITIETANKLEPALSLTEGMHFDHGYLSERFITDAERQECVLEDCRLLIYDRRISNLKDLLSVLEQVARARVPLLIIADDVEGEALATLVVNSLRGTVRCAAVRAPGTGDRRAALLKDIAVLTGGKALTVDLGLSVADVGLDDLGTAERVIVSKNTTTILGGKGSSSEVEAHINLLRSAIAHASDAFDREKLQERLTSFAGRVATVLVGGKTPPDVEDQRYRAESAMHAARTSIEEGWVCGGGAALLNARALIAGLSFSSPAEQAGAESIAYALERPFDALVENSKQSPVLLKSERQRQPSGTVGFNAESGLLEDLAPSGVLESAKALRNAVEIAFSYARVVLRTDVWTINDLQQQKPGEIRDF